MRQVFNRTRNDFWVNPYKSVSNESGDTLVGRARGVDELGFDAALHLVGLLLEVGILGWDDNAVERGGNFALCSVLVGHEGRGE